MVKQNMGRRYACRSTTHTEAIVGGNVWALKTIKITPQSSVNTDRYNHAVGTMQVQ